MSKKTIVSLIIIVPLLLAAGYRFLQIAPYPIGGGRGEQSPDKQFTVGASDLIDRSFFGAERSYYEFTVKSSTGQQIRHVVMEAPPEGMISWRDEGVIEWATNSSAVTFSFKGTQLTLSVKK